MKNPTIEEVLIFATEAHEGQTRSDGSPYINHPKSVAARLESYGFRDFVHQAVALLHDVIEDCDVTQEEIAERFGSDIAICVQELTNIVPPGAKFEEKQASLINHAKNMNAISARVKICDRIDNLVSANMSWPDWKVKRYASAGLELAKALCPVANTTVTMHQDLVELANGILGKS